MKEEKNVTRIKRKGKKADSYNITCPPYIIMAKRRFTYKVKQVYLENLIQNIMDVMIG